MNNLKFLFQTNIRQTPEPLTILGNPASGSSPQTATNLSSQAWPYLQSPANNPALAATAQSY